MMKENGEKFNFVLILRLPKIMKRVRRDELELKIKLNSDKNSEIFQYFECSIFRFYGATMNLMIGS